MICCYKKTRFSYTVLGGLLVFVVAAVGLTKAQAPTQSPLRKQGTEAESLTASFEKAEFEEHEAAYRKAYDTLNGDMTAGTFMQKMSLLSHAAEMAEVRRKQGRTEESLQLIADCQRYIQILREEAERMENPEERDAILRGIAGTHFLFASSGMYEDAVIVAKLSPATGQYNASEYLTRVARIVAGREGFDKAEPILKEAIAAAKNLPFLFWQEGGIIEAAQLYEEAGRSQQARALIDSLSANGQARGLVALFGTLKKKEKPEATLIALLQESEQIAEQADDKAAKSYQFLCIAQCYVDLGRYEEAQTIFTKSGIDSNKDRWDEFHASIAFDLIRQGKVAEAEAIVERLHLPSMKARILLNILRREIRTADKAEIKRLIEQAEPFVREMRPEGHRMHSLLYLAAYKIKIGEGRQMMDDLIAGPQPVEGWSRDESVSRAVGGLCYAGLYEEAQKLVETMTTPEAKAASAQSILAIYLQEEKPEEFKKRFRPFDPLE